MNHLRSSFNWKCVGSLLWMVEFSASVWTGWMVGSTDFFSLLLYMKDWSHKIGSQIKYYLSKTYVLHLCLVGFSLIDKMRFNSVVAPLNRVKPSVNGALLVYPVNIEPRVHWVAQGTGFWNCTLGQHYKIYSVLCSKKIWTQSPTVEGDQWWTSQTSVIFLSGATCRINDGLFLLHCSSRSKGWARSLLLFQRV